jgi:hypothetical protein
MKYGSKLSSSSSDGDSIYDIHTSPWNILAIIAPLGYRVFF